MFMDKKNVLSTVLIALAAVALIALGAVYGIRKMKGKEEAEKAALDSLVSQVALPEEAISSIDLEGTYNFKIEADTLAGNYTATVTRGLDDTYILGTARPRQRLLSEAHGPAYPRIPSG